MKHIYTLTSFHLWRTTLGHFGTFCRARDYAYEIGVPKDKWVKVGPHTYSQKQDALIWCISREEVK